MQPSLAVAPLPATSPQTSGHLRLLGGGCCWASSAWFFAERRPRWSLWQVDALRSVPCAAGRPCYASLQPARRSQTGTRCYSTHCRKTRPRRELLQATNRTPTALMAHFLRTARSPMLRPFALRMRQVRRHSGRHSRLRMPHAQGNQQLRATSTSGRCTFTMEDELGRLCTLGRPRRASTTCGTCNRADAAIATRHPPGCAARPPSGHGCSRMLPNVAEVPDTFSALPWHNARPPSSLPSERNSWLGCEKKKKFLAFHTLAACGSGQLDCACPTRLALVSWGRCKCDASWNPRCHGWPWTRWTWPKSFFFFFNGPFFLGMSLTGPPLVSAEPPIPYRHLQAA